MATPLRDLIIDDSEDDALLLVYALRKAGYDFMMDRNPETERIDTFYCRRNVETSL